MTKKPSLKSDRPVKFSVITVTRNAARHIVACVESVATQTYPHVEHIIMDGASTDGTVRLARERLKPTDQLISEPDQGIYDAMNRGLARATGDYILFVGADDYLMDPEVLTDAAAFIAREGWPDALYGDIEVREVTGDRNVYRPPELDGALDLMICGCLPHQATFAHRSVFESTVGRFNLSYRVQSDYDWFLRLLAAPDIRIARFHRVVSSFALGGASSRLQIGQEETYAIQNAFPVYRQPEWMERRLHAFQRELLAARIRLQAHNGSTTQRLLSGVSRTVRRVSGKLLSSASRSVASNRPRSELEQIIAPEIVNDEFHALITSLSRTLPLTHVLEIGSSAGGGSTSAFVEGLRDNPHRPSLHCMEVSKPRFEQLARTYKAHQFVHCHNVSSIRIDEFPSEAQVTEFYNGTPTALNQFPLERVIGWLRQDIAYIRNSGAHEGGIDRIKTKLGIQTFDLVLIDGSEFAGSVELDHVYGASYILLDDTNSFKCYRARERLSADPAYECIADNQSLRGGYSAFRRITQETATA